MKAILMLEDGHSFNGEGFGQPGESLGEVIFNTAVVGYQEMLTDPANAGKILVMTYPLIGNYGCAPKFNESKKAWACGLVIKEKSRIFSNWQAKSSLDDFAKSEKLSGIQGIDTRTLTVHLRNKGGVLGIISTSSFDKKELLAKIEIFRKSKPKSWLPEVSVSKPTHLGKAKGKKIAILDLGITNSIIKQLENLGFSLTLFPYNTTAKEILKTKPRGLIISGGPEQDPGLKDIEENIRALVNKLPILAISAGFQVLASSLGAKVVKMKLGHRGVNYPIFAPTSYRGEITCQNHSYAVDAASLNKIKNIKITDNNLNDRSVEAIESKKMKIIAVQYNPASPGFNEVNVVFKQFAKML